MGEKETETEKEKAEEENLLPTSSARVTPWF